MKLIRFGNPGQETPGYIDDSGNRRDASAFGSDFDENFFKSNGPQRFHEWLLETDETLPTVDHHQRWAPPIARPSKIVCVGLNYSDHAKESGMEIPQEPVLFFKSTSALCGPYDNVILPPLSAKTDWEVELALIIGKEAKSVSEVEAINCIAGYTIMNDVSERAYQLEGTGQWVKGKSCDTFAPLGPFLATPDEIGDVHSLPLWLSVNQQIKQQGNTDKLIFKIPFLIHYISHYMTLLPGDVISTGTPPGVGMGSNPQEYLQAGDVMELGIEGLGTSKQTVISA